MLYPRSTDEHLDPMLFQNPTSEYRGAPFWAWNCELKEDKLLRQVDIFRDMGMSGFHIHARNGLATEYLGEEFMRLVQASHDRGAQNRMLTWLYDEDRYPSHPARLGAWLPRGVKIWHFPICCFRLTPTAKAPRTSASAMAVDGWYVDEDIHTVLLPAIHPGENSLEVTVPIGRRVGAEAMYLLGDFGVRARGPKTELIQSAKSLCFGDITTQACRFTAVTSPII
ncbi:MAG: hypothetical protein ACOX55_01680 [Christensenellales bacterium]|jgi:hypothetical protein